MPKYNLGDLLAALNQVAFFSETDSDSDMEPNDDPDNGDVDPKNNPDDVDNPEDVENDPRGYVGEDDEDDYASRIISNDYCSCQSSRGTSPVRLWKLRAINGPENPKGNSIEFG